MNLLNSTPLIVCVLCLLNLGEPLHAQSPATVDQPPMPSVLATEPVEQPIVAPEIAAPQTIATAMTEYVSPVPASLSGHWSGSWLSCTTGHKGPLQASFCQLAPDRYQVTFRGRFFKFIPFRYSLTLQVVGYEADRVLLSGSHKLGPIMGTFTYSAYATAGEFVATYRSKQDYGQFRLSRTTW